MATATKSRKAKSKPETNGTPAAPAPDRISYDVAQKRLLDVLESSDSELARRVKEREVLDPIAYGLIRQLSSLVDSGQIENLELKYFEPGEYGDTGSEVTYPPRIEFSWRVVDYDHRYSNAPDFSITLMGGMLQY